ncbi:MAG: hypothetical protein AB1589_23350 [Cyanobacteriota bacterium]
MMDYEGKSHIKGSHPCSLASLALSNPRIGWLGIKSAGRTLASSQK